MPKSAMCSTLALSVALAACGGGPPSPPALEFGMPNPAEVRYEVADTTVVSVSMMGQSMELSQRGTALFGVRFADAAGGLQVTLTVEEMAATINNPIGAPIRLDESAVTGPLVYTVDRFGNATISERPEIRDEASQMVSGLNLAHAFLPALPGRAAQPGDAWVDTVRYEGEEGPGTRRDTSVLRYSVVGDTVVDGRTLLVIDMTGTSTIENDMNVAGMAVSQSSETEVEGRFLWDVQRRLMVESHRTSTGSGTVSVPVAPGPLPIVIRATQRARLQQGG